MSYSRRQLYAMGEPLGDCATYRKADGGLVLGGGGGGGGSPSPVQSTTTTQELPEWARGYAQDVLAKGAALTDINQNPYQVYEGERIAPFSSLQNQAFDAAANLGPNALTAQGGVDALMAGRNYQQMATDPNAMNQYMSPYIASVLNNQIAASNRGYDISAQNARAEATKAGAYGGSRGAIMQAENERARNAANQGIVASGLQNAFQNAQQAQQFGSTLGLQGAQAAAGAGQNLYGQAQNALLTQGQMGAQQQAQYQKALDVARQDFLDQQNYPYKQLSYMSDLIHGTPIGMQASNQVYQAPGSVAGQVAGLGMGALGFANLANAAKGSKEGGAIHAYADGGGVESAGNIEEILSKLSDAQLVQAKKLAVGRRDIEQATLIDQEMAHRASMRQGVGAAPINADAMASEEHPNSISAFASGGSAVEKLMSQPQEADTPVEDQMFSALDKLKARSQPAMDALNEQIESGKGRAQEIRDRGLNEALMNYGFKFAQAAARPGAKFLGSAAEASPVLAESAINTNKAIQNAQDTYTRLKMDQQKYQIALDKGDMQTAASLAGQMRQEKQAAKMYGLNAAHMIDQYNNQRAQIAATSAAAGRPSPFLQVVNDLASDPANKGKSREELMTMASKAMYGAQYGRTDAMLANNFEARKKDDKQLGMLNIQLLGAKTPEQKQKVLTDINARENQIRNEMLSIAGGGGSGSISSALPTSTPSMADRGFRILGTE